MSERPELANPRSREQKKGNRRPVSAPEERPSRQRGFFPPFISRFFKTIHGSPVAGRPKTKARESEKDSGEKLKTIAALCVISPASPPHTIKIKKQ